MLKVYVGLLPRNLAPGHKSAERVRTIVAAKSLREAAEILGINASTLKNYFDLSIERQEILTANKIPGAVFQSSGPTCADYKPVRLPSPDNGDSLSFMHRFA